MAERHRQLDEIKDMINNGDRSAAIIRRVIAYPDDFWTYMNSVTKCDDLIYSNAEYGAQSWIKKHRAKIICDFLIYWSNVDNRGPINEFIDDNGNLREGAYATIQTQIANDIAQLKSLHGQLKIAIAAAGANVNALMEQIKIKSMQLFAFSAFAADSVSVACKSAGGVVVDTTAATVDAIDKLLGQLLNMELTIDIPATARVSKDFIKSIVGEHTDTIILMLEGLLTVCAGTVAVKNYDAVFAAILNILGQIEGLLLVGTASTILYGIGTVMDLLSKKLAATTEDKLIMLKDKSTRIAEISRRTRNADGSAVTAKTILAIRDEIRAVVEGAAVEGAVQPTPVEGAVQPTPVEAVQPTPVEAAQPTPVEAAQPTPAEERAAEEQRQEAARAASRPDDGRGHGGGKKRAKSQKKPRKKASKSKHSKKAGKKTRKSRKKTRGKKH